MRNHLNSLKHSGSSYAIAILSVVAGLLVAELLTSLFRTEAIASCLLCTVIFVAWLRGFGPALLTIALSLLAFHYYVTPPFSTLALKPDLLSLQIAELPRLVLFSITSLVANFLMAAQQRATEALQSTRDIQRHTDDDLRRSQSDLEARVQDLEKLNVALQIESAERQRAEHKSYELERDLQVTIDTIPISVATFFPDGSRDFVNQPWRDYTGISQENARAATWPVTVHPDDAEAGETEWHACLASGKVFQMDLRIRRADGEYRWNMARRVPLRDDEGNIVKWYGIAFDIEDQKRAEGALRESEASLTEAKRELQQTIDMIPAKITVYQADGTTRLSSNLTWCDYTGLSLGDKAATQSWAVAHPDDVKATAADWSACLAKQQPFQAEVRLRRRDGVYRWHVVHRVPLRNHTGDVIKWYAVAFDIEDRKRAEDALRQSEAYLTEAQRLSHTGSFGWDVSSGKLIWSAECYRIYEVEPATRPNIELGLSRIHPEDAAFVRQLIERATADKEAFEIEYRLLMPDGRVKHLNVVARPLIDNSGELQFMGAVIDITASKRAEDALRQSEAYLAEAQRLSHTGSFGWNVTNGKITWSEESYRIFEYDPATKATIQMVLNRVHPDDVALVGIVIEQATINKESFDFEHRLLMPDGSVKHLNVVAHPSINNSGELQFVGAVMDITARMLADDALRQSEAYLAEALGIANIGYWERFPATKRITWSDETFRIFGLPRGDGTLTFERYHELVHPEDLPKMITAQAETEKLRAGDKYDVEYRTIRPNGEVRFLHSRGNVTRDKSGQVRRMFGIVEDMTERKLAEAALLERAALLDLSHDSIFVRGMDDIVSSWNRGAEQLYGWNREEAVGRSSHQLLQTIFSSALEEITSELLSTGRWEGELVHTKRDGTQVTVASRWSLRQDEHGRPVGILETNNDHTERRRAEESLRKSEQRYRHLFHHMPIGLWQINSNKLIERFDRLRAEGVTELRPYIDQHPDVLQEFSDAVEIVEVNEQMVKILGARDASEILGFERFHHINPDTFLRGLESRWRGETTHQQEAKIVTLDGRTIDVVMTATRPGLVIDPGITLMGILDITERVRAQEMLQRVQADFAHAARVAMLGELTASIAHEVNQPLAAIVTNSEVGLRLLNRSKPDSVELREIVTCVVNDARRATDIIARVRTMATRQAQEQTLLSVDEVIRETLLFLRHEVQSHGLAVTHHPDPAAPKILGDRTQLQQVFVNLTVNAIQAMTQAETTRRMLAIRTERGGPETLSCTIEDSGPGINPAHLDHLFDSFFTTKGSGMGLGLAISRSIIEAHGGYIRADNDSAFGGARFKFTLPAKAH